MRRAFTLIELLVVISIVALLSSVVLSSLNSARDKARIGAGRQFAANAYHVAADSAAGIWDFEEGPSNTLTVDRSGTGNNGTLYNMTMPGAWSTDTYSGKGYSLLFDGANDYVEVPYSSSLAPTSAISFGAWFKPTNLTTNTRIISKTESGGYTMGVNENVICPTSTLCAIVNVGGTYYYVSYPTSNLSTGQWYYGFATYDGDVLKLYLDGKEIASNPTPNGNIAYANANAFCIGAEASPSNCSTSYFSGYIDEPRVYAKGLTANEVGKLYADGLPRHSFAKK